MKITPTDYERVRLEISDLKALHPTAAGIMKEKGYSDTRILWEYFNRISPYVKNDLYQYLDDNNIETALRRIV